MATLQHQASNQPNTGIVEEQVTGLAATPQAVKSADSELHGIHDIDNSANSATTYLKGFTEASGSVTPGTTAPNLQIPVAGKKKVSCFFFPDIDGIYTSQLSAVAVKDPGTGGTDGPAKAIGANFQTDS